MSDRSSDKLESNDPGYGILGADLSVEGIKIPNIPVERWTLKILSRFIRFS